MQQHIAPALIAWYAAEGRRLPWRETRDPYRIWLSEVILQQTRVQQGLAYYERFIAQFPTIDRLAAASEDEVLKLWQGLGYYSRARNLHAAARQIMAQFGGQFPTTYAEIRTLRGVGDYTAAAIASMAFDLPHAVVDGNVYRVLARLFDLATPIDSTEGKKSFSTLAQSLLDLRHPATYNQAIMDFGALCCTPQRPSCDRCPLADRCLAYAANTHLERPVKQGRTTQRDRYFHYLHLSDGRHTLLVRRGANDIWQGLYEFPLIEQEHLCEATELLHNQSRTPWLKGLSVRLIEQVSMPCHILSHQRIHARFFRLQVDHLPQIEGAVCIDEEALGDYAISRLTERYLER
ncbi:MAG: A/G-specific adenine glycosylase [Alistipes sp.]|nr:A/G-specific adenine glycosylase [Alistipes sp.]